MSADVLFFDTLTGSGGAQSASIPTTTREVFTFGYANKNDGGGAHYKRYDSKQSYLHFETTGPSGFWGLVPTDGAINPLQAGASGGGSVNERDALQECINFIDHWNLTTAGTGANGLDADQRLIKLIIPASRNFLVDTTISPNKGLKLKGPITIEGEDRGTSTLSLKEDGTHFDHLMTATDINRIALRNFTMKGCYVKGGTDDGVSQLLQLTKVDDVQLENVCFTLNRAVIVGGDSVRNLTMRRCLLSESRNGGIVINNVQAVTIENNDFYWIPDDPVALTVSDLSVTPPPIPATPSYFNEGGTIRVSGNRCFGCRGLNVNGAKNVIISENIHVLGRGRAIHVGVTTTQSKG